MSDGEKRGPTAGSFKPGQSGNVKGRPADPGTLKAMREDHTADELLLIQRKLAKGEDVTGYDGIKPRERAMLLVNLLDRLLGKAIQQISSDISVGASAADLALIEALRLTPEERRRKLAEIEAADAAALAAGPPPAPDAD